MPGLETTLLLCLAALAAGWIDAVAGGGGLVQLPALLLGLPAAGPEAVLGTNKLSSVWGTASAAITFVRREPPDLRTALPMAVVAFLGAGAGAASASLLPPGAFRPLVLVLLVGVLAYTALRPGAGEVEALRHSGRRHYGIAVAAGAVIGFYDGIFGPGTGSFLVIVLVGLLGYSFVRASGAAKVVNAGTNCAALLLFASQGAVLWQLGLVMGACNLAGGVLGAQTAITRGSGFVRGVLVAVVSVLILRLGYDVLRS